MWVNEISLFAKSFRFVADQMEPKERKPANGGKSLSHWMKRGRGVVRISKKVAKKIEEARVVDSLEAPFGYAKFFGDRV